MSETQAVTESVLVPFAGGLENWNGNVAPKDSAYRADAVFIFRVDRSVQRRGTHHRNAYRTHTEEQVENAWNICMDSPQSDWTGVYDVKPDSDAVRLHRESGDCAYADRRYLALAARLLEPDRVTLGPAWSPDTDYRNAVVIFWRDGQQVGAMMQRRNTDWQAD